MSEYKVNDFDKIIPRLYLGQREADNHLNKFDLVINLDYPNNGCKKKDMVISDFKPRIIKIGMIDGCVDKRLMKKLFDFVGSQINSFIKKDKNVLVRCYAGRSRSCSFVIAYLMKYKKMSFDEAYDLVKRKRPCVEINKWFAKNLRNYI